MRRSHDKGEWMTNSETNKVIHFCNNVSKRSELMKDTKLPHMIAFTMDQAEEGACPSCKVEVPNHVRLYVNG